MVLEQKANVVPLADHHPKAEGHNEFRVPVSETERTGSIRYRAISTRAA
jgi:hypothetical protein